MGEEVAGDLVDLALLKRGAHRSLNGQRFGLCEYPVELDENWLRADVRLAKVLGVESTLEEDLAGLAVAEKLCGRLLQPQRHLLTHVVHTVTVLGNGAHCPLIPPIDTTGRL